MTAFVVQYDRKRLAAVITSYDGPNSVERAADDRARLEAENQDRGIEVVSIFADSIEDLRKTHSRYFINEPKFAQRV